MNALLQNVPMQSILIVASILIAGPVQAQNLPWCAIMDNDGNTQCNYYTEQQCLQTLSGVGGRCILNPAGSTPQLAPTPPSSDNAQGLLPLQLQNPGPPPGLGAIPPPPVQAQNLPWCAIMDNDGNTQCNYYTEQQCLQTLSGVGGRCILNPAGSTPQLAPTPSSSDNAQGLLPLQLESPGPPPGLGVVPPPPNN